MLPVGFEPAIPASERPQTHALDRAATGKGVHMTLLTQIEDLKLCKQGVTYTQKTGELRKGVAVQ